jgi:hypothetical protein
LIAVPFAIWSIPIILHHASCGVQLLFGIALGPSLLTQMVPALASLTAPAPLDYDPCEGNRSNAKAQPEAPMRAVTSASYPEPTHEANHGMDEY